MMAALKVWMNGSEVATWRHSANAPPELTYASSWLESESPRPLSLSLPLPFEPTLWSRWTIPVSMTRWSLTRRGHLEL